MRTIATRLALALALCTAPGAASALHVLLTNDDGQSAAGIQAMRTALCNAGHQVTLVAPATDQSGRGGSINTGALSSSSAMSLTRVSTDACGIQYSLAAPTVPGRFGGTPVDSLKAGLNVVLQNVNPDLIVSGLNQGQNLSKPTSNTSGTVGAALTGGFNGIPAIAGSVGVLTSENPVFGSTTAAYPFAAQFIVNMIATLQAQPTMLPKQVKLLNVNFPVPYGTITGVAFTKLADRSDLELPLFDRNLGFPPLLPGNPGLPSCASIADGQSCSVGVGVVFLSGPDSEKNADTDAHHALQISNTPRDGDMTVGGKGAEAVASILGGLAP
jgi:5'/3'-nucleotidase SurE